jgi:hypothetical protein
MAKNASGPHVQGHRRRLLNDDKSLVRRNNEGVSQADSVADEIGENTHRQTRTHFLARQLVMEKLSPVLSTLTNTASRRHAGEEKTSKAVRRIMVPPSFRENEHP